MASALGKKFASVNSKLSAQLIAKY